MDREHIEKHDLLNRYRRGELPITERAELEEFILDQPDLVEQLELDMMIESGLRDATVASIGAVAKRPVITGWRRLLPIAASAAYLLLAASIILNIYLATENTMLRDQSTLADSAQSNIQILRLPTVLSEDEEFRPLGLLLTGAAASADLAVISVQLTFPEEPTFRIEIVTHPGGQPILVFDGVEPRGEGDLIFSIPLDRLPPGKYYAEISSGDDRPLRIPFAAVAEIP